jgi:hypothetical protein
VAEMFKSKKVFDALFPISKLFPWFSLLCMSSFRQNDQVDIFGPITLLQITGF